VDPHRNGEFFAAKPQTGRQLEKVVPAIEMGRRHGRVTMRDRRQRGTVIQEVMPTARVILEVVTERPMGQQRGFTGRRPVSAAANAQ
jgi:hypothetical protein